MMTVEIDLLVRERFAKSQEHKDCCISAIKTNGKLHLWNCKDVLQEINNVKWGISKGLEV